MMMLPPLIFAAFATLFLVGNFREDRNALPSTLIGREAPMLQMGGLPGYSGFDNDDLRAGEVTLVNFWASWCPPCRAEHPMLEEIAATGISIYGVNARDEEDNALRFLDELGNPFAGIGTSLDGRSAIDWGVYGMPETFVVAADGTVLFRYPGEITRSVWETRLRPVIEQAR
jgi:cytochrome c biogenesis protein CcmG/thiol:disulfide interchange protein DsbE